MKKLIIAAIIAVSIARSAFAAPTASVNYNVLRSFKSAFKGASDMQWTMKQDFAKSSFVINDERVEAFYNLDGEMIGTSKAITLDAMHVDAKRAFAKWYSNYTVKEAISFEGKDENAYYISAENQKEKAIIKVSESNHVSVFSQTSKQGSFRKQTDLCESGGFFYDVLTRQTIIFAAQIIKP